MSKCKNCVNLRYNWCEKVYDSPDENMERECVHFRKMANADRIRSMSDEELAELLSEPCECYVDPEEDDYRECGNKFCIEYLLNLLQQPAENPKEDD